MMVSWEQNIVADVKNRYGTAVANSTERFLSLRREMGQCVLKHLVAMGRELIAVKKKLPHGKWMNWVRDDLGTNVKMAERTVDVTQAYDSNSTSMSNFESLDATRLYRLARVRPEKLRQLSPDTPLPIEPGGAPKPLPRMTAREFDAALDLYEGRRHHRPVKPSVPGIPLPALDPGNREVYAGSFIAAIEFLIAEAPRIRALRGKLSAGRKEETEAAVENLRKVILRWPAWATKHR